MGQESGLEEHYDNLGVSSAGEGIFGVIGAVEADDPTQVSLEALWLQHDEQYGEREVVESLGWKLL